MEEYPVKSGHFFFVFKMGYIGLCFHTDEKDLDQFISCRQDLATVIHETYIFTASPVPLGIHVKRII